MSVRVDELTLGTEPDAVPNARQFVVDSLAGSDDCAIDDATLIATELVTNALLHVGPPVRLRVRSIDDGVRIEVEDSSRQAPVRARESTEAMTGRGIALVSALAGSWGVEAGHGGGKVVWAELPPGGVDAFAHGERDVDVDALLAAWSDDAGDDAEPTYEIRLGDVPTDLLLDAKAHVDNLVREFTLTARGATSSPDEMSPALAVLIEAVVHRFERARQAIKRQALASADRGDERTDLTLTLPVSAAAAGEDYLAALDEADNYARAARLLTLETPPAHRVFRRWYVEAIVQQLRAHETGQPPPIPLTFERRLIAELGEVASAKRASDRSARLQEVTAALAGVTTTIDVAEVIVTRGCHALHAAGGGVVVLREGAVDVPAVVGYAEDVVARLQSETPDENLPAMVAAQTGEPVWIESPSERDERFPELAQFEPGTVALCAVPMVIAGRVLGALRFSFGQPRLFDDEERKFAIALAAQAAQALQRADLYETERIARADAESLAKHLAATAELLSRLQKVTAELTGAQNVLDVAQVVVSNAAESFGADSARIYLLDEANDLLRSIASAGGDDVDLALDRFDSFPVAADLPGSEAIRTQRPIVVRSLAELAARWPALEGVYPDERSLLVAPLIVSDHRLGVMSLTFRSNRVLDEGEQLSFLNTLADTCAQALERSEAAGRALVATDRLTFLAEASVELSSSIDYRVTLAKIAQLVVPRLADWCTIHIVENGELQSLATVHSDPAKVAWAEQLQERYPVDPSAPSGAPNVLRTGSSEIYPEITDQMLVDGALDKEHLRVLRELGMTSVLVVPLTARTGVLGVLTLVSAESGRRYTAADCAFAEDLARRAAVAVETAHAFHEQSGRLEAVTRVAEAAQLAILAPVPSRVGPVALAGTYISATAEALVGGDLYEVVARRGGLRLIIGDVRGKGLDAVRKATVVLGEFRAAAVERDSLIDVATQMDARLTAYFDLEDFVTCVIAEILDDGTLTLALCGHPPALLAYDGTLSELGAHDSLPLGLGATPSLVTAGMKPGARLLLYTDGILEARDAEGRFVDFDRLMAPLADGDLDTVLERVIASLRHEVGSELGDDLALLVAEYRGL